MGPITANKHINTLRRQHHDTLTPQTVLRSMQKAHQQWEPVLLRGSQSQGTLVCGRTWPALAYNACCKALQVMAAQLYSQQQPHERFTWLNTQHRPQPHLLSGFAADGSHAQRRVTKLKKIPKHMVDITKSAHS
jgi:hypothetical protein